MRKDEQSSIPEAELLWEHFLSTQLLPLSHQHAIPLPINFEHISDELPGYSVHGVSGGTHPFPLVKHPVKCVSHSLSVAAVELSVHLIFLHY